MNLTESIREHILNRQSDFPALNGVQILADGGTDTADPPMVVIDETGSQTTTQDGVPIRGVSTVTVSVELHTVPSQDGTHPVSASAMSSALYSIIGDISGLRDGINAMGRERVLDIFADAPILTADDGRRVATTNLEILAHLI